MKTPTRIILLLTATTFFAGCSTSPPVSTGDFLSRFYQPIVGASPSKAKLEPQYAYVPSVPQGRVMYQAAIQSGYHVIGTCSFSDMQAVPYQTAALDYARKIKANLVMYGTEPMKRETVNTPVVTGFSTGQYVTTNTTSQWNTPAVTGYSNGQLSTPDSTDEWNSNNYYPSNTQYGTGTTTTYIPGQTYYKMVPTVVMRTAHYLVFLARS